MRQVHPASAILVPLAAFTIGCEDSPTPVEPPAAQLARTISAGPYAFPPPVFDIAATPDGGILVAQYTTIRQIRSGGVVDIIQIPTLAPGAVNGLAAIGAGSFFATGEPQDLAVGASVWHVSHGRARLIGDVEAFETANDPDAFEGPQWKNQACEEDPMQGFSAGPQSNPYHVARASGSEALVADAAGNTLLSASTSGVVDWVALFTPPVDQNGDWRFLKTALNDPSIDCYVQPVPTSVDVGPDGAWYVGELTGAPSVPGWSRVWRIEPGSRHVVCPSAACQVVVDGLTSVIDLEFGPDGALYVAEYDANGWLAAVVFGTPAGGTLKRCDVASGACSVVESGLTLPSAITFDKWGHLWLLESNIIAPTVSRVD